MTKEMSLKYVRIYADDHGDTHFSDEEVVMQEAEYAPPAPPLWVGPHSEATGMTVVAFPPGWFGDFHPVPRAQWMMVMTGAIEVGVSDGEKRTYPAGSIAYLEDVESKGHSSRSVGDEMSIVMVTEIA